MTCVYNVNTRNERLDIENNDNRDNVEVARDTSSAKRHCLVIANM